MITLPTMEEVKQAVFQLNGDNATGPDVGLFFQTCWHLVAHDVINVVKAFFCGQCVPRYVTHTNLVLLPKKEEVKTFSDLRPISLNNFVNKVISRVLHKILLIILAKIISPNQAGFVKGRSISENVLLA